MLGETFPFNADEWKNGGRTMPPTSNKDYFQQRFIEHCLNAGQWGPEYDESGAMENFEEWRQRGPIYHYLWPREKTRLDNQLEVYLQFYDVKSTDLPPSEEDMKKRAFSPLINKEAVTVRILVFDHIMNPIRLSVVNGVATVERAFAALSG